MEKRKLIWYWIITVLLSFFIFSGGLMQTLQVKGVVEGFKPLGYPTYFISLIGVWKILGVIALLVPKFPLLKEWAYAGFFFTVTGALVSHFVNHDGFKEIIGPSLFTVLIVVSWYFRPASRTLTPRVG